MLIAGARGDSGVDDEMLINGKPRWVSIDHAKTSGSVLPCSNVV